MYFDRQVGRQCGLHAVRNLLETSEVTEQNMNDAASWCVEESKDALTNHVSHAGDWSMDTLKKVLNDRGYDVQRAVKVTSAGVRWDVPPLQDCMENVDAIGFIRQAHNHYTSIRKNDGRWMFCDSMRAAPTLVSARDICTDALYERCNLFFVKRR